MDNEKTDDGMSKDAEVSLRTYYEYQRALLDNFPFLVWLKDSQSRFLAVNRPFAQACGFEDPLLLIGKTDLDVWPRELALAYRLDDVAVMENGAPKTVEEMIEETGKKRAWFETFKSPVRRDGKIIGTVGFSRDITERKQAEYLLSAERERLMVTLRSIGDGVIATDTRGKVVIMNRIAEALTGWSENEARGKPLSQVFTIINELTRRPCINSVDKVLATGAVVELANHTLLIAKDGSMRNIGDSGAPILDDSGATVGVVLVFRDMTEKQKLLDAAQKTQKLESLGVLAGGIAHDFNNLLSGIFGYIDLARQASKDDLVREHLQSAMSAMGRARSLTLQLLTFSKGGAPKRATGPLFPFVKDTVDFALSGSNVKCAFEIQSDLWPCNVDKNQIGQVIDNIVINAVQAMPAGGPIKLTAMNIAITENERPGLARGDYVKLSIEDKGTGIPRELLPRIFDPFFTTKQKGSGLGLATTFSILSRHGGHIEVESEPGKGTVFHVYLPASHEIEKAAADTASKPIPRGSGRILLMDDEESIRKTVGLMLQGLGYSCECAENGSEAIRAFDEANKRGAPFTAAIFDLTVAGEMGGREAAEIIRKTDTAIKIFVSSGYAQDPVLADPTRYGFDAGIPKPYSIAELAEMLNRYLIT
jgi:PAS domain S-box-containing protein